MIFPFIIIDLFLLFFGKVFDYYQITIRVHLFLILNFIVFWIAGKIIFWKNKNSFLTQEQINSYFRKKIAIDSGLLWVAIILILVGIKIVLGILSTHGLWYLGTEDFEKDVGSGIYGHTVQFSKIIFIYIALKYFLSSRKSIFKFTVLGLLAVIIILAKVKYHIIWAVLITFFMLNFRKNFKSQSKVLANITYIVVMLFAINYIIMFFALTSFDIANENMWKFIFKNFFDYFVSGPIMLDKWLDLPETKPITGLFIVFKNFYNAFWGTGQIENAVKYVSPGFLAVGKYSTSNVGTSFGVYYLIGGMKLTVLSSFILGLIYHKFYLLSSTKNNLIYHYLNAVCLTMSTLSFFVIYFTLLSLYEMFFIFVVLLIINDLWLSWRIQNE
jgi:oligosaccharide repeat unit polymerase